jgi:hypothetical protein
MKLPGHILLLAFLGAALASPEAKAQPWHEQQVMKRADPILFCERLNSGAFFSIFGDQGFKKKATLVQPVTSGKGFVTLTTEERALYTSGKPVEVRRRSVSEVGSEATIKKFFHDAANSEVPLFLQIVGAGAALTPAGLIETEILNAVSTGSTVVDAIFGLGAAHRTHAAVLEQVYVNGGHYVESALRHGPAGKEFLEQTLSYEVKVGNEVKTWFLCSSKIAIKP